MGVVNTYQVGYAPYDGFAEFLNFHRVPEKDVRDLGLINIDPQGYAESHFKNRIILPIIHAGWVVGFGGRTLGNALPKYLNSRASILYNKSSVLYGLHIARSHIEKHNYAILVEGYFDVLGLRSQGVHTAVATCGTAFTKGQAALLRRYTNRVFVMLDADAAGRAAAEKAKQVLQKASIFGGIIELPDNFDPDEFVKENGKKAIKCLPIKR
jgi:DNA primase